MKLTLRLSEGNLTEQQLRLRDRTYRTCQILRENGFDCEVIEHFVTKPNDTVASIVLK